MGRTLEVLEYRNQTEVPTEPGLYWAKKAWWAEIDPIYLTRDGTVYTLGDTKRHPKADFVFFGPLPRLQEG